MKFRASGPLLAAAVGLAAAGCGQKLTVAECYILDIVAIDPLNQQVNARTIGVRTGPGADTLDLADIELVTRDGSTIPVMQPAVGGSGKPTARQFGKHHWILFAVADKHIESGGLQLRVKSKGILIPLPDRPEERSTRELS